MSETGLVQIIEGALLAAGKPMTVAQLAELFEEQERPENALIRETLKEVAERCDNRGFELIEVASGFRFQVRQSLSPWVARLWQERPAKYSRAMLETPALIAYRQPITRGEIEEIRGVAVSSNIIKTLHEREWIRVVGHRDVPGRPAMYATTRQFLDYFNLKNLDQLPALAEIRDLDTLNAELGFTDPMPDSAETDGESDEAPGLTVVGGTDHVPESGVDAAADEDAGLAADIDAEAQVSEPEEEVETEPAVAADQSGTQVGDADTEEVEPQSIEDLADALDGLDAPHEESEAATASEPQSTLADLNSDAVQAVKPDSQA